MSTHNNCLTNVTSKNKISQKIKESFEVPNLHVKARVVPVKTEVVEDRSFLEMTLYKLKKYYNG